MTKFALTGLSLREIQFIKIKLRNEFDANKNGSVLYSDDELISMAEVYGFKELAQELRDDLKTERA